MTRGPFIPFNNVAPRKGQTLSVIIRFPADRGGPQRPCGIGGVTIEKWREERSVSNADLKGQ